jgi:hypothetical protein
VAGDPGGDDRARLGPDLGQRELLGAADAAVLDQQAAGGADLGARWAA